MKYALIGCGRISPNHIVAAQRNGLNIVALFDLSEKNMDDKIRKFEIIKKCWKRKSWIW